MLKKINIIKTMKIVVNITNDDFKNILEITKKRFKELKNKDYCECVEMFLIWQIEEVIGRSKRIAAAAAKIKQIK